MRQLFALVFCATFLLPAASGAQQNECELRHMGSAICPHAPENYPISGVSPYHILFSYHLTDTLAAQFDPRDGAISAFWEYWESDPERFDFIELNNQYPGCSWERSVDGWSSIFDAHMTVRSAWNSAGLYLFFKVTDDQFVNNSVQCMDDACAENEPLTFQWANDAMDMYLDKHSTHVHAAAEQLFYDPKKRITSKTIQFVYQFGADQAANKFLMVKTMDDNTRPERWLTFDQAAAELSGLAGETVVVNEEIKIQEWFIPWELLDKQSPEPNTPGSRIAFCCGYNDADGGTTGFDALRWRNAADPTKRVPKPGGGAHVPTESWGDIQFLADGLDVQYADMSRRQNPFVSGTLHEIEYYDMRGRLLRTRKANAQGNLQSAQPSLSTHAIILERIRYTNGQTKTRSKAIGELPKMRSAEIVIP